jgi:hypothetical protein
MRQFAELERFHRASAGLAGQRQSTDGLPI